MLNAVNMIEPITGKRYRKLIDEDFVKTLPIDNSFIKNWTNEYKDQLNVHVYSDGYERRTVFIFYRHYNIYGMDYNYVERHSIDDRMIEEWCWDDVERWVVDNIKFKVHELDNTELITKIKDLKQDYKYNKMMVSLYIPKDKLIKDVIDQLINEHERAKSINDASIRYDTQCSLESIISKLEYLKEVPENGIAYFGGFVAKWFIPPKPIVNYKYRIDSVYDLNILEEMVE